MTSAFNTSDMSSNSLIIKDLTFQKPISRIYESLKYTWNNLPSNEPSKSIRSIVIKNWQKDLYQRGSLYLAAQIQWTNDLFLWCNMKSGQSPLRTMKNNDLTNVHAAYSPVIRQIIQFCRLCLIFSALTSELVPCPSFQIFFQTFKTEHSICFSCGLS